MSLNSMGSLSNRLCMEEEFYVDFLVNCDFCLGIWKIHFLLNFFLPLSSG